MLASKTVMLVFQKPLKLAANLKDCFKCHIDPTDDACTKDCLIGPGPCIHENKVKVGECVAAQSKTVGECVAAQSATVGTCVTDKRVALAKAEECLACAVACKKDE